MRRLFDSNRSKRISGGWKFVSQYDIIVLRYMPMTKKYKSGRVAQAKLKDLAEFRYQLRRFLSFSEMTSEVLGISAQRYQVLQVIATVPEGRPASISYLAERMMVRHNSAVELVDRTARSGLVRRVADESDHRRSLVEVTARGGELLSRLAEQHLLELELTGPGIVRALRRLLEPGGGNGKVAAGKALPLAEEKR
jgi:DNA-binding MarR family transcriptional regulator